MTKDAQILVIDDDAISLKMIRHFLSTTSHKIIACASAHAGLQALKEQGDQIALVLLDMRMPEMDGKTCLAKIKTNPQWQSIPVVMLTSISDMDTVAEMIAAGATDYLVKPVTQTQLLQLLKQLLEAK